MQECNDETLYGIDMNKCRRNILLSPKHKWYVYNVLDNIEPFNGNIVDGVYYVEYDNKFPLRGNMCSIHGALVL